MLPLLLAVLAFSGPASGTTWNAGDGIISVEHTHADGFTASITGAGLVEVAAPLADPRLGRTLGRTSGAAFDRLGRGKRRPLRELLAPGPGREALIDSMIEAIHVVGTDPVFEIAGVVATEHPTTTRVVLECTGPNGSRRIAVDWRHGVIVTFHADAPPPLVLYFITTDGNHARAMHLRSRTRCALTWDGTTAQLTAIDAADDAD